MTPKLDPFAALPKLMTTWLEFSLEADKFVEPELVRLIQIRASQINGCANCINMHVKEARLLGMDDQRIDLLPAWRDAPCYSDRERALIGWVEALTRLSESHPPGSALSALQTHFSEQEQVAITLIVLVINGWNRLCVGFNLWSDHLPARRAA
jgi:AhpD family alkylhydroperoxidase